MRSNRRARPNRLRPPPEISARSRMDRKAGWPMALAVGDANYGAEFVFPTSEEAGHPSNDD